ncbi:MAG: c(7)-type cytochrome triheme domain-containing protein [Thermodesulfobacteriota bacterium]
MNKNVVTAVTAAMLTGTFLLGTNASATDDYDVRAFGPKHPIVWDKPTKVVFEHRMHTDNIGLECSACHGDIFAMQRGVALRSGKLTMAAMAEGQFCGACHDGETAFASDTNCAACHTLPEQDPMVMTKPVKAVIFSHKIHIEEFGLECDSCHDGTFAMKQGAAESSSNFTMEALYNGLYCGKCHDGDTAFASNTLCNDCHIGVKGYNRLMGVDPHAETEHDSHGGGH